jgi:hypothetical protein
MRLAQQPRAGPRDGLSAVGGKGARTGDKLTVQEFLDAGLDDLRMLATALHAR